MQENVTIKTRLGLIRITSHFKKNFNRIARTSAREPSDQETQAVEALIRTICNTFFTPIAQLQAEQFQQKQDHILDEFQSTLKRLIVNYLARQNDNEVAKRSVQAPMQLPLYVTTATFSSELEIVFTHGTDKVYPHRSQFLRGEIFHTREVQYIIECIALSIQEFTLAIPFTYYKGVLPVSEKVCDNLLHILHDIHNILKIYIPSKHVTNLRDLGQARRELYKYIWQVDDVIGLPFKSMVTASLAEEDLYLYARSDEDAKRLAHQMIMGDGVFLVTGYRGVGKSTFINRSISLLGDMQLLQEDPHPWQIIPISISVAKSSEILKLLSLCIWQVYETFKDQKTGAGKLLAEEEASYLAKAYYCSAFKYTLQQGDSATSLRHIEGGIDWEFKFASPFLSMTSNTLSGLMPNLSAGAKASKDWSKQVTHSIALPDYDENKAEGDIVRLIKLLARPQKCRSDKRIKLVFIFDEISPADYELYFAV